MGTIRVLRLTNESPEFYRLLGPYLAQRRIVQELGFPPYDDPGKVWFVTLMDEQVAGFVGLRLTSREAVFCSDYVLPEHRRQGIYKQLMAERLAYALGKAPSAIAVVTLAARHCYEQHGFALNAQPKHKLKRYIEMVRSL